MQSNVTVNELKFKLKQIPTVGINSESIINVSLTLLTRSAARGYKSVLHKSQTKFNPL